MKRCFMKLVILLLCCLPVILQAAMPLPAAQAFQLSGDVVDHKNLSLHWQVADGYYLYTDKFHFESEPTVAINAVIPQGDFKYDAERGRQEVLTGDFVIPLSFSTNIPLTLVVNYQGCSHDGFCYPPTQQKFEVNFANNSIQAMTREKPISWVAAVFDQEKIKQLLTTQQQSVALLMFFVFGLLLAFTPCVLPMLPILSSIIMGDTGKRHPVQALLLSFFYVVGSASAYAFIGFIAASIGQSLQVMLQNTAVVVSVSVFFLLLAAINFGWFALVFPRVWQKAVLALNHRMAGGSYTGVFFMGVVSTLIVSPCITAPLIGVLLYIAETSNKIFGASALFVMGMGLGVPLMIAGTSLNYVLPRSGPWLIAIKHGFGFVMLGMAIWLVSRVLSPMMIYGMSAFLLLVVAIYIAFLLPRYLKRHWFCLLLGTFVGSVGFYTMAQHSTSWLHQSSMTQFNTSFLTVHTILELETALSEAKKQKMPVLVDFYADWCTSCIVMEKTVLRSHSVRTALKSFRLLRVDLTQNTADDRAIMQRFNVIAPPTFLLFDRLGIELTNMRIVGEVDAPFFLSRLQNVI